MPTPSNAGGTWALRLSTFFGAHFLINGVSLTYLPVWLDSRGLTAAQIALTSSLPMLLRIVLTPTVSFVADRTEAHRLMMVAACSTVLTLLATLNLPLPVLLTIPLVVLMLIANQTVMPLADTLTMAAVRRHGIDYGRVRLWGSITFILATYVAGWAVAARGADVVVQLLLVASAVTTTAAFLLPRPDAGARSSKPRLTVADALALVADRRFLVFLATAGTIMASHAVLYVFGVLHWRAQGLSASFIASLWAISVIAEIVLFWGARWLKAIGAVELIMIGAACGIARWIGLALDPSPFWLVPLQVLHAGTFAATHLGSMHWIGSRIPQHTAGTAQALLSTTNAGVAMGSATMISGWLYQTWSGGAYFAMAAMCAFGLVGAMALRGDGKNAPAR